MNLKLIFTMTGFHLLVALVPLAMLLVYARPVLHRWMLMVYLGVLTGFINLQTDEVQFPALLLIAFGFFLGYQERERIWMVPLVLAIWVPLGQFIRLWVDPASGSFIGDGLMSILAFIPAIAGTAAGYVVRSASDRTLSARSSE